MPSRYKEGTESILTELLLLMDAFESLWAPAQSMSQCSNTAAEMVKPVSTVLFDLLSKH